MRRTVMLLVAATLSLAPVSALARSWHGLSPGSSSKNDVIKKFGSPTRELQMTARYDSGLVYQGKAAQEHGADEAQFFFDGDNETVYHLQFAPGAQQAASAATPPPAKPAATPTPAVAPAPAPAPQPKP